MSNNIFNLDPTTHQASLSKVNIGSSEDASLIVLGKVTKVYYHQGTLDFKLTSGVSSIVADGSGNGTGSARIPLDYFGQDSEGRTYGHYRPVQIGDTVAIAYLNGHKTSPIVIGVYAPNGEQYEAISPTLFDSGDDKDGYIAETGLAEQHVHHSGQISYRSGSGRLFESLNGYSFMVIDDDTSQDYSELYTDLSLVPYSTIDGKIHDPQREKAGDWLLVHEDNPNGLDADNHITRFYVNKSGDFELVFTNTSFTGVSTVLHMDKNGMQLNKYIGHQKKKAGLPRASEEDQTYTADFDSAPTTVTFDLGKTKDDTISLKSSTTVDSKEQATNLEVRTDGVYINDVKLFDSNSNSLSALSMFLDGGVMDFSKITVKNFSGDNIEDSTIDGTKLKDKTVTADKMNIIKLSDISPDMGTITAGSIQVNNGTSGSTGVKISGDASSDPDILTPHDKAQLQQQLNALYSQCQALMDYGTTVGIDVSELKTNENSLKNLTDWIFETEGNVKVDRVKIDEAITDFMGLLETYRSKFTSQLNQKVGETSNKANSIYQGSQEPDRANVKEGDLWLQTNSDGTSNIMQYTNSVWQEANLKGYQDAKTAAEKAQETADKLPHNYYQATEPSGTQYNDGDLWYQNVASTSDGKTKYNVYKWDISSKNWVQFIDNNVNNNYVASSAPADPNDGDFWTDTDGTLKQYQNGTWVVVPTQGPQGIPGTDGKTSYTHIAYATSADGKSNFSVDSFSGASYIGLLVDFTSEDSTDPTKYTWSLMKGTDGTDGKDGVPGKPGADGKTSYVHFAYANSSDGTNGFNLTYFANALYVGTYTDFTEEDSSDHTKYTWSRLKGDPGEQGLQGLQGPKGEQGIQGPAGADGKSSYTHIAYANSLDGKTDFTVSDSNRTYIGMYVDFTSEDSTDPTKYAWSLIKGADGADGKDGVPGKPGADGKTPYLHIAYADSSDGKTNFSLDTPGSRKYIGSYTDFIQTDSTNPALYSWQLVQGPKGDQGDQGIPGAKGVDGKTYYTWIKYATDSSGSSMSDSPTGMSYIGIAYNKESSNESSTATDYTWSLIKGADGVPGKPGADGQTTYFHIAYANSADGSVGFTDTPGNNSYNYFGTYTDYNLTSSDDPTKYTWVKMFDSSKKRNFTSTPTTPYDLGDIWTTSGSTYFCTTARPSGAFTQSDWTLQQLTIQSLDSNLQANINGDKNLLMVDDVTYYSNPVLDSTSTYNGDYPFDYTSTDTTYTFQVQAKSTVSGDYVHMYPAWGNAYSQLQNKTTQVSVTTSPSVPNQTSTFTSTDSETKLLLTTDWVTYTCTVSGTWDKGSVLTALLGQVYNSETKGTVSFRSVKLVAGNAIKDYTRDDSITVAQGSNYWDLTTLQKGSSVNRGGLNLWLNSKSFANTDINNPTVDWNTGSDGIATAHITSTTSSGGFYGRWNAIYANSTEPFAIGDSETFSVEMKGSGTFMIGREGDFTKVVTLTSNWTRYAVSGTVNSANKAHIIYHAKSESCDAYVRLPMVEEGTVAHPWSPNPSDSIYASWLQNKYYTPWYPISEGQRVFLTHYDYPAYPGITTSASVEFADSDHNFISNGTNNHQGNSTLDGNNSQFTNPQSLNGVYYNERMLKISIVSQAATTNYQDLYIQTSGLLQSKLAVSGRGTTVATFDPYSGRRVDTQYWDTFATVDNANALVNYLKSISSQDLVVAIATRDSFIQDSTDFQTASQDLCTLLQSYGLPSTYAPADLQGRVSFAFVGHTPAYQGSSNETLVSSSKGDGQVSTLTAYVSNGHISSTNNTRLVAYANAPAKTAYFRAGYSFSPDEVNRVNFMVTVDKLSTNYSSNIADVSSNAVRKDVTYKGVTLNDNGLTATADKTQVIVNSSNGFAIKKSGVDVFHVDTNGNLTITGSTISTGNISGVDFSGQDLTLSGTLSVNGSIVAANGSFTIDQNGMEVSPQGGGSVVISKGGLTIQGPSVGSQSTAGTYGSNDSLAGDAGLFATKDKSGNTKTWITSSGTLIAQDAVIHGNVSVDKLTLTSQNSEIVFGSGFKIDGNGAMTSTSKNAQISNGTYSDGVIEGSELDIGTAYHSKLSEADKYRYHVSSIGETTFGMSQDLNLMNSIAGVNSSYLSLNNAWTTGQVNFNGTGSAPNNAMRALGVTSDIYADSYGWNHRFSAPVNGVSDTRNYIPIWDKDKQGSMNQYTINYNITDSITSSVNQSMNSNGMNGWGGSDTLSWTLSTVEFPRLVGSLFTFGSNSDLYPTQNKTIKLSANVTYVFGAYIWHCGLHNGARVTIEVSDSDTALQNTHYFFGNPVSYQQSGYSIVAYTPSSDVYLHSVYVESANPGGNQGDNYGVPLSVTDPFAVDLSQFTSKLIGGRLDTLTSLGGRFGMPYPHLDASQFGVLGLIRSDNLTAGDKVVVSIPINYESGTNASFAQINLGVAKPGNDSIYTEIDGEFQPLMPGYYTYDFYFVWKDEYKQYINNNLLQLNLISKGISSNEKAYVVSVDSVRMGIFVGQTTTSSTQYVNEYQTKFSPLGSLQLSHISNPGNFLGVRIAGQTQLTSEGLEINSSYSFLDSYRGGMHISINGKSGIGISGEMNFGNPATQPALSFYGSLPYSTLLEHTIEPQYNVNWDESNSASGIWFDSYGNAHGYGSSLYWHVQSPSYGSNFAVPLADGNEYGFALSSPNGQRGDNILRIGLVHFNKNGGGYVQGNYPALLSGSGDTLAGIAFGAGYVIIFGNRDKRNNFWSFPQGTDDGHTSDSGTVQEVTGSNNM
jgi:hypothetical protein